MSDSNYHGDRLRSTVRSTLEIEQTIMAAAAELDRLEEARSRIEDQNDLLRGRLATICGAVAFETEKIEGLCSANEGEMLGGWRFKAIREAAQRIESAFID